MFNTRSFSSLMLIVASLCVLIPAHANKLDGAWQLVSGEYVDNNGQVIRYESIKLQSIKVISANHFSFTSVKNNQFWASGTGTYQLKDGQYHEILQYNSFGEPEGKTYSFDTEIVDEYWYNTRWQGDTRVEYEVWKKIN